MKCNFWKNNMLPSWTLGAMSIGLCLSLVSCESTTPTKEQNQVDLGFVLSQTQLQAMDIRLSPLQKQAIEPIILATGKVRSLPNSNALISGNIGVKVEKVLVKEGQNVYKGQGIVEISSFDLIELQEAYLLALSQEKFLAKEYERQATLHKSNVGSVADFQKAETDFANITNKLESLGEKLKLIGVNLEELNKEKPNVVKSVQIPSPIDGSVFKLNVTLGQRVEATSILAEVLNLSEMQADIDVFEKDIDEVYEGQEVEIQFLNNNLISVKGKVFRVSKSIDPDSRSIPVYVDFKPPKNAQIFSEMAIKAKLKGSPDQELMYTVPYASLVQEGEIYYVVTAQQISDTLLNFNKTKVSLGDMNKEQVQINFMRPLGSRGLVVTQNAHLVDAEMKKQGKEALAEEL